ncbi:MAG TPA: hypothetical protein VK929_07490 [Longimicrobiales bacterium]|nr:hypothetical protein [Longimicrobiales bacterium]
MWRRMDADGDSWRVTSFEDDRRRAVRTVVFHCLSNTQRPYRVVEIPDDMLGDDGVDGLSSREMDDLFRRTHSMDYSHDRSASPGSHGFGDPPLE